MEIFKRDVEEAVSSFLDIKVKLMHICAENTEVNETVFFWKKLESSKEYE